MKGRHPKAKHTPGTDLNLAPASLERNTRSAAFRFQAAWRVGVPTLRLREGLARPSLYFQPPAVIPTQHWGRPRKVSDAGHQSGMRPGPRQGQFWALRCTTRGSAGERVCTHRWGRKWEANSRLVPSPVRFNTRSLVRTSPSAPPSDVTLLVGRVSSASPSPRSLRVCPACACPSAVARGLPGPRAVSALPHTAGRHTAQQTILHSTLTDSFPASFPRCYRAMSACPLPVARYA